MPRVFITIILILGSGVVGPFYLRPAFREFQRIRTETKLLRDISAELDELTQNRDSLIQSINAVSKDNLRRIEQTLPSGPKAAEFLVLLEALAKKNEVVLRQVSLTDSPKEGAAAKQPKPAGVIAFSAPGDIKDYPVDLTVSGTYSAFKDFLRDIERSLRIVDVQSISFSAAGRGDQLEVSIRGKTYYQ